jgi:hypothetical protein
MVESDAFSWWAAMAQTLSHSTDTDTFVLPLKKNTSG